MHVYKYKIQRDGTGLQGTVLGGVHRQHIGEVVYEYQII